MAEPTQKTEKMDRTIKNLTGVDRKKAIRNDECVECGKIVDVSKFKDKASFDEYRISGLCSTCQDKIFGEL